MRVRCLIVAISIPEFTGTSSNGCSLRCCCQGHLMLCQSSSSVRCPPIRFRSCSVDKGDYLLAIGFSISRDRRRENRRALAGRARRVPARDRRLPSWPWRGGSARSDQPLPISRTRTRSRASRSLAVTRRLLPRARRPSGAWPAVRRPRQPPCRTNRRLDLREAGRTASAGTKQDRRPHSAAGYGNPRRHRRAAARLHSAHDIAAASLLSGLRTLNVRY